MTYAITLEYSHKGTHTTMHTIHTYTNTHTHTHFHVRKLGLAYSKKKNSIRIEVGIIKDTIPLIAIRRNPLHRTLGRKAKSESILLAEYLNVCTNLPTSIV